MSSRLLRTTFRAGLALAVVTAFLPHTCAQNWERRSAPLHREGVPDWEIDKEVPHDLFTFVRIQYSPNRNSGRRGRGGGYGWRTDFPDAELNFSFRLHEMTTWRPDPNPHEKSIRLEDPKLFDYPFIYIVEPGGWLLEDEEVPILRKYLLGGGFLMLDDFWGEREWENAAEQLAKVFPDRTPEELPLEHPIFHGVFDLKEKPQLPSIGMAFGGRSEGITWERPDAQTPHYRAIFDDKGRMMVIICHNTDNGDGWEQEGVDPWYFQNFSEPKAYPVGINILFYAMTH